MYVDFFVDNCGEGLRLSSVEISFCILSDNSSIGNAGNSSVVVPLGGSEGVIGSIGGVFMESIIPHK